MSERRRRATWDAAGVRALRRHLGLSQDALSDELGVRQQTVSEWETGQYRPRGATARLLSLVAERAGFAYSAQPEQPPADNAERLSGGHSRRSQQPAIADAGGQVARSARGEVSAAAMVGPSQPEGGEEAAPPAVPAPRPTSGGEPS